MRTETISLGIYLISLGLVGLLGSELYLGRNPDWVRVPFRPPAVKEFVDRVKARKPGLSETEKALSYGKSYEDWWTKIYKANLTGKLPPEPRTVADEGGKPDPEPEVPQEPITDILTVFIAVGNGDEARIKVRYNKPEVEVPPELLPGGGDTLPVGQLPGNQGTGGLPMAPPALEIFHGLGVGDSLWRPFHTIRFERLEPGPVIVFSRPHGDGERAARGERQEEEVVLRELFDGIPGTLPGQGTAGGSGSGSAAARSPWQDPGEETRQVGGVWMISVKDQESVDRDYDRILNEEFQLEDYVGSWNDPSRPTERATRKIRGVGINKVSESMRRRFGIQAGWVLLKINGKGVQDRGQAIQVGKAQYGRGVRRFELTFLNHLGREVVQVYRAPEKK